uniref:Family with sequence similarity 229 member A n=1 Tax=Colobus angolensis palliatus TaxID=336983 RepID=A0A2K5J4Q5_COLAP
MLPSSTPGSGHAAETCPAPPGPERSPAASARAAASSLGPVSASGRPLRRCPGCHCLTLLHVPIDVYLAMGGSPRARAT